MFDRPAVTDDQIVAVLEARYGRSIAAIEFLALGHDAHAWTFRAVLPGGERLFVKIRRRVDPARLELARFLQAQGFEAIVAPIGTLDGAGSVAIDDLHLIAYPFVDGALAAQVGLSDPQWTEYGRIVAALHAIHLSRDVEARLPRERFVPAWIAAFRRLDAAVAVYRGDDALRGELVAFWRAQHERVLSLAQRAEALGESLRQQLDTSHPDLELVPCHGDIHTHNLLVEPQGGLRVIDWDEALLAPRERDLMFVMGSPIGLAPGARELALFETGYGPRSVDPLRLAFYHLDWAAQDLTGYAEQVMLDDISPESRAYALRIFLSTFEPGGEAEVAERFDRALDRGRR